MKKLLTTSLLILIPLSYLNAAENTDDSTKFDIDSITEQNFSEENLNHPIGIDINSFNQNPSYGEGNTSGVDCGPRPNPPAPGPSTGFYAFQVKQNNYYNRLANWIECNDNN